MIHLDLDGWLNVCEESCRKSVIGFNVDMGWFLTNLKEKTHKITVLPELQNIETLRESDILFKENNNEPVIIFIVQILIKYDPANFHMRRQNMSRLALQTIQFIVTNHNDHKLFFDLIRIKTQDRTCYYPVIV